MRNLIAPALVIVFVFAASASAQGLRQRPAKPPASTQSPPIINDKRGGPTRPAPTTPAVRPAPSSPMNRPTPVRGTRDIPSGVSFTGNRNERIVVDPVNRSVSRGPYRRPRPDYNVNNNFIQQNNQTNVNVINQGGRNNTVNNVNVQNVQNIVNNVTNVTNVNNQNINNTVVNNFGRPNYPGYVGPGYVGPGYVGSGFGGGIGPGYVGHHRYDYIHDHWHSSNGYWNFRYRPSIWMTPGSGVSIGLAPVATYNFVNPYLLTGTQNYFYGYDYSQPIRPMSTVDQSGRVTEEAIRRLDAARQAFRLQQYDRALELVEGAIRLLPDDPVMHEFRALALFARRDYDAAATVIYSVLGAGPGSDWNSIGSLYDSQETYMAQLRNLSSYVASVPDRPGPRFLLAYHLMVVGYPQGAYDQLLTVQRLRPDDRVTAEILRALQQQGPQ